MERDIPSGITAYAQNGTFANATTKLHVLLSFMYTCTSVHISGRVCIYLRVLYRLLNEDTLAI